MRKINTLWMALLGLALCQEAAAKDHAPTVSPAGVPGSEIVMTTVYSMHHKEAMPVWVNKEPTAVYLNELFRCRGFAFKQDVDPRLVRVFLEAASHFKSPRVVIISAYRSPKLNDTLLKKGRNVVSESRHTKGEAIDFSLDNVTAKELGAWIWKNFDGGLGVYVADNFVHIDVGPKRRWWGD